MKGYILIVDDEPAILESLQYLLEYEGYAVKTTPKGDIVMNMSETNNSYPRLIILDMFLSGSDGRDIVRKLKLSPQTHDIPVMMISAYPNANREAEMVGADDFIPKPFEMNDLLGKVRKFIH